MLDYFLEIFSQCCIQFIPWIPGFIALHFLISMISSLFFKEK